MKVSRKSRKSSSCASDTSPTHSRKIFPRVRRGLLRLRLTAAGRTAGFAATVIFALYNGALGLYYRSVWHGSICVYYILLSALRAVLLAELQLVHSAEDAEHERHRKIFLVTSGMMLAMNAALILPVSLMVLGRRPVNLGLIPAIASAAYTTCKISSAAVGLRREKSGLFRRELKLLRFVDALVSVLVLQNTLLVAVDGEVTQRMRPLAAVSSAGIFLLIFAALLWWIVRAVRSNYE